MCIRCVCLIIIVVDLFTLSSFSNWLQLIYVQSSYHHATSRFQLMNSLAKRCHSKKTAWYPFLNWRQLTVWHEWCVSENSGICFIAQKFTWLPRLPTPPPTPPPALFCRCIAAKLFDLCCGIDLRPLDSSITCCIGCDKDYRQIVTERYNYSGWCCLFAVRG